LTAIAVGAAEIVETTKTTATAMAIATAVIIILPPTLSRRHGTAWIQQRSAF
jgi:hypothetical protein